MFVYIYFSFHFIFFIQSDLMKKKFMHPKINLIFLNFYSQGRNDHFWLRYRTLTFIADVLMRIKSIFKFLETREIYVSGRPWNFEIYIIVHGRRWKANYSNPQGCLVILIQNRRYVAINLANDIRPLIKFFQETVMLYVRSFLAGQGEWNLYQHWQFFSGIVCFFKRGVNWSAIKSKRQPILIFSITYTRIHKCVEILNNSYNSYITLRITKLFAFRR